MDIRWSEMHRTEVPRNGSLVKRAKTWDHDIFHSGNLALENAIETSDSMKCRGYGEKEERHFSLYRFDKRGYSLPFVYGSKFRTDAVWIFKRLYVLSV